MLLPFKKFGIRTKIIDIGEYLIKCPSCEGDTMADVMIISLYYYFLFVPIFPTDKEAVVFCKTCGLKREGVPFDNNVFKNFDQIKHLYRHSWITYIGAAIMVLFVVIIIGTAIAASFDNHKLFINNYHQNIIPSQTQS
jgi:hypothetical protein